MLILNAGRWVRVRKMRLGTVWGDEGDCMVDYVGDEGDCMVECVGG